MASKLIKEEKITYLQVSMNLCIENPKETTKKKPELMYKFSKVEGYKINIHDHLFFYTVAMDTTKVKVQKQVRLQ